MKNSTLLQRYSLNSDMIYTFFYKQRYFSTQPQCCLPFSRIEPQMLLKCCLNVLWHKDVVLPRHTVFSIFVSCLRQVYLCLIYIIYFSIIIFLFILINHINSLKETILFFGNFYLTFSHGVLLSFCLIFCQFQPGVAYKSFAYKKSV